MESDNGRPVLVCISIVVRGPRDEPHGYNYPKMDAFLDGVSDRFWKDPKSVEAEPWFEQALGTTYRYLDEDDMDVRQCERCNGWTISGRKSADVHELIPGEDVAGVWLCARCINEDKVAHVRPRFPRQRFE